MDLNLHETFNQIDTGGMYQAILDLPAQLRNAYALGSSYPLPHWTKVSTLTLVGMGGSAIAADLLNACFRDKLTKPLQVIRDYSLPKHLNGEKDLVIFSSYSGNTEEVLAAFTNALERKCTMLVISTGGKLSELAQQNSVPVWAFSHLGQPRAAIGWSFGLLTSLMVRLGVLPEQKDQLDHAAASMAADLEKFRAEIPTARNPAKRMAGQLVDQFVTIFAAEHLSAVARRWKTQLNELSKCVCQFEIIPEADHNAIAGIVNPESLLPKIFSIFLQSNHYHLRNNLRMELTFSEYMVAGIGTDLMRLNGENVLSEMWQAVLFGDLVAYYLAILYEEDPTAIEIIDSLKMQLG